MTSFKKAVKETKGLEKAWQPGLEALRKEDRPHIKAEETRALRGSVDIDTAYQKTEPNANRWDFAIGYKHTNRKAEVIYWVELHTASDSQIKVVVKKAEWLLNWLRRKGKMLNTFEREIVWVSSGATRLSPNATQKKQMAEAGLRQLGGFLHIPKKKRD